MATDTTVNNLVINVLSKAQYNAIENKSETELYLVPDEIDTVPTNLSENPITSGAVHTALQGKQPLLVSGTNIKTVNSNSLLGSGDISVGTVTSVTVNGTNYTPTSGVVNLGTISGGGGTGGDINIIESVKVNGTVLIPDSNKAVDITAIPASIVTQDATHRLVTDTEKSTWDGKQAALVSGTNIKTINNESILGSGNITISGGGGGSVTVDTVLSTTSTNPVQNAVITTNLNGKADKIAEVNHGTSDTSLALTPNVLHVWGTVGSLTLTLGTGASGVMNEYMFQFDSGSTATTLSLPSSVKWITDNTIEANKTYQVSILNNLAVMGGA